MDSFKIPANLQNGPLSPEVENGAFILLLFSNARRLEYEVVTNMGIKIYTVSQNGEFGKIYETFKVFLNDSLKTINNARNIFIWLR